MPASKAYFMMILHAHMPYVLDIGNENPIEERWLYEAMAECYLRLIKIFDSLISDNIPFCLSISLSPTLLAQWENPATAKRFLRYLERQINLSESEMRRTEGDPEIAPLSYMYKKLYEDALHTFEDRCDADLINTFRSYQEKGVLEIATCPATHSYLPLLRPALSSIRTQINTALKEYTRIFGMPPSALWLPECGYFPGLDDILAKAGVRCTFLDTDTIRHSKPAPRWGTYAPIVLPSGLMAFGRDIHTAKQVWSSTDGYPGDFDYRDFYRDIGFDLDIDYLSPYLPGGERCYTGFKYYRIEEQDGKKREYCHDSAKRKISIHADDFIAHRLKQVRQTSQSMDSPPVICAFYDAELFGHWWFEGPLWLEEVFRKMADCKGHLEPITPREYIKQGHLLQTARPPSGSWGWKGYNEVWLNSSNKWVYPHLFKASEKMEEMARQADNYNIMDERALNQAARELLLAQSSDWTFILHNNTLADYATIRIKEHIGRFWKIIRQLETSSIDVKWLRRVEELDDIFPSLSYRDFYAG
ncbi:DUF1957 domain-containing protein [bacterium]|nr:DUF1957 domain-containing protein [bacterium]